MTIKHIVTAAAAAVTSCLTAAFGGWSAGLTTLIIFMLLDYVTGIITALFFHNSPKTKAGAFRSSECFKGLLRKFSLLVLVIIAVRIDIMLNVNYFRDLVVIAICISEGLSIVENIGLMGVPIPAPLLKGFELLKHKVSDDSENVN